MTGFHAGSDYEFPDPPAGPGLEPLWLLLADCQRAIEEEIVAVQEDLTRRGIDAPIPAHAATARGEIGSGFRYGFHVGGGRYDIRADDRVRIRMAGREARGIVLAHRRPQGVVDVLVLEWLGERLAAAELEFDPTWLLRELSNRLDEVAEDPARFYPDTVLGLFGRRPPRTGRGEPRLETSRDLNEPQTEALARLLGSDAQLVWGPPGTGKSRLVARAALELAREGRVLVTATTNGAVDEVAGRVARLAGPDATAAGRIVRVGSELTNAHLPGISLESLLARRVQAGGGGILRSLETLEASFGIRPPSSDGGGATVPQARAARLLSLARARDDREAARAVGRILLETGRQAIRVLEEAEIVLTTLARLSVREELRGLRFDSVLVDEASTAPLPYVALAGAVAARRAFAVGDFQQLPPVVVSRGPLAERWLKTDLFRETAVVEGGVGGGGGLPSPRDRLCAMLDVQYRMDPAIRAVVSDLFYDGRLRDAPEVIGRRRAPTPLLLVDTAGLGPTVERVDGSRRNRAHAEAVLRMLADAPLAGETEIAVVAPYRAHVRHLRDLVRDRLGRSAPRGLEISTIHRFQGREKDVLILDTVDAPPGRSWFLDEIRNPDLPRLLNVALSRARDMLIVLASPEGLRRTLPEGALLRRLLERLEASGVRVPAESLDGWPAGP